MKNVMRILALAVILALCLANAALAEGATVTVGGSAQVNAPTDHAVIRLGISTRAETPSKAQTENNERTEAVMKALTETCGIAEDKIATSYFCIYTLSDWNSVTGAEKVSYQATHDLSVTVDNIDQTGAVIDACVAAGANNIENVSFESSTLKDAYDQALTEAVADAKRKAELLAAASGMKLGEIVSITTVGSGGNIYDNTFRFETAEAEEDAGGDTKLAPGTQSTAATVTVTWELVKPE